MPLNKQRLDEFIDSLEFKATHLILSKEEVKILSQHLMNEYLTHEEPARSVLLKIHQFANE